MVDRGGNRTTQWARVSTAAHAIDSVGSVEIEMKVFPNDALSSLVRQWIVNRNPNFGPVQEPKDIQPFTRRVVKAVMGIYQFSIQSTFCDHAER